MCLAIPGKILSKENIAGVDVGQVQFGAITRQVALGFVPEVEVGDYVMVHVGFAIQRHRRHRDRGGVRPPGGRARPRPDAPH